MEKRFQTIVTFYDNLEDHPNAQDMDDLNAGTVEESFNTIEEARKYGKSLENESTYRGFIVYDTELSETIVNVVRED